MSLLPLTVTQNQCIGYVVPLIKSFAVMVFLVINPSFIYTDSFTLKVVLRILQLLGPFALLYWLEFSSSDLLDLDLHV